MGLPYDPVGFVGLIDAARIIAATTHPSRWRSSVIPVDELALWTGLRLQKYPSLIGTAITTKIKHRDPQWVNRYCDFIEAQHRLRDGLAGAELTAAYLDEAGKRHELPSEWWRGTDAAEGIAEGTAWIEVGEHEEALRYFVVLRAAVAAFSTAKAGSLTRRGRPLGFSWGKAEQFVRQLIEHHGMPSAEDPELPNQAAVEERVATFFSETEGRVPSPSSVRSYVRRWLEELRAEMGNNSGASNY